MQAPLKLLENELLLSAIRKSRRDLKDFAGTSPPNDKEVIGKLIDEIIELSVDDVPVAQWPVQTVDYFLTTVSTLTSSAADKVFLTGNESKQSGTLQTIADILCNISIATSQRPSNQITSQVSRAWITSRLTNGLAIHEIPEFKDSTVASLRSLGLSDEELTAQVHAEVLSQLTKRLSSPSPSVDAAPDNSNVIRSVPAGHVAAHVTSAAPESTSAVTTDANPISARSDHLTQVGQTAMDVGPGTAPSLKSPVTSDASDLIPLAVTSESDAALAIDELPPLTEMSISGSPAADGNVIQSAPVTVAPPILEAPVEISAPEIEISSNPAIVPNDAADGAIASSDEHPPSDAPDISGAPAIDAGPREPARRPIAEWQRPFRTEKDVNEGFTVQIEKLLATACNIASAVAQPIEILTQAKTNHFEWLAGGQVGDSPGLTTPAIQSAVTIADKLLDENDPHAAFNISNAFGEITKMLFPRHRDRYGPLFERFVTIALSAMTDTLRTDPQRQDATSRTNDIESLSSRLRALAQTALGTYFHTRERSFVRSNREDGDTLDRVISQALARHFDLLLRSLLVSNRPQVREYVRANMPLVYRLKLPKHWNSKRKEWERLLTESGYEDAVRLLRDMGDLIDPEQVGEVQPQRRDEIVSAAGLNDYARVAELLSDSAKELRSYLYMEAQRLLQYREPNLPSSDRKSRELFERAQRTSQTNDRRLLERALTQFRGAWERDINNLELQDWVAYLEAKTGSIQAAEQRLDQLQRKRAPKRSFVTDWNLAVLKYERKNENDAYKLLVPLLDTNSTDGDLIRVVLALSLKLDDRARFLDTVPRTMSVRYNPLAIIISHEMKNTQRVEELLAQLQGQWRGKWELPSIDQRFSGLNDINKQVVNKAIVEGQIEQLIAWLEARIVRVNIWIPNYQALADVLENQKQDIDGAFRILRNRLDVERQQLGRQKENEDILRQERRVNQACEDLLHLCRRSKRPDLGTRAYELAQRANAREGLLQSFSQFAPAENRKQDGGEQETEVPERSEVFTAPPVRDPRLVDRLMWVNAGLTQIRNVNSYIEKTKEIEEFSRVVAEVGPVESEEALNLINNITTVIGAFQRTDVENPEDRVTRRTLYGRVTGYEKELGQLLRSGALSQQLSSLITPYSQALQQVVGDLSRLAGVGPVLDIAIENPFISLEGGRTTLVLRVTDKSERPVTDISVDMISQSPSLALVGNRKRNIARLESQRGELVSVPIERVGVAPTNGNDATFSVSLRASAEGHPDVDLGIKKLTVPIKTFQQALGSDHIPKLFQESPLRPSSPDLFQGRDQLLSNIRNSFYGGTQRERYFFDGIRRVGKTTILNFLPQYVPENIIPVIANFEMFGVRGRFSSAIVLHRFATLMASAALAGHSATVEPPHEKSFEIDPGRSFGAFLDALSVALPGKVPLLVIDEFQELLQEIAASGTERGQDTLVLDQLRAHLDTGRLYALFTGSVRFDRLSGIVDHRIFGSLKGLGVSFLNAESVAAVLRGGLEKWAIVPPESVAVVHQLTGGYPWLVQKYGLALVDLLNSEHRTVVTPKDVEDVTREKILWDDTLFEFWWPTDQLSADEERFIGWILRKYPADQKISIHNFFNDVGPRDQPAFRRAFGNLRAAEVLDSTQTNYLQFTGTLLRRWLEQHMEDGQLHIRKGEENETTLKGQAGIFIDHENLIRTLESIGAKRGVDVPKQMDTARVAWFSGILKTLLAEAVRRVGRLEHRVAVSFWDRANEARISKAYQEYDFQLKAPEETGKGNEVDFKLGDEARRARERALRENTTLARAIVVTGDSDLSHAVRGLKADGVSVQVWGGSRNTGDMYIQVVGAENFFYIDDICGL